MVLEIYILYLFEPINENSLSSYYKVKLYSDHLLQI